MKEPQGDLVQGRTRWRRFAALMVPSVVAAGAIVVGMANGAIAASFSVSGQSFKVAATNLHGDGFKQFSGYDQKADGTKIPVATSVIGSAKLSNLCQSVNASNPLFPFKIVLRIEAGADTPATASNMVIGLSELSGDATFTSINIGADGGQVSGNSALTGSFAQSASAVDINNLKQVATSVSAGTFTLNGLSMKVLTGDNAQECF